VGLLAGQFEWYYPDNGKESIASIVGYSQPAVSSIQRHARVMAAEAAAELSVHRDTGDAHVGSVHMGEDAMGRRPDLDSVVYLAAHDEGKKDHREGKAASDGSGDIQTNAYRAVMSIEFGHYASGNGTRPIGPKTKKEHKRTWVPGIGVLQHAAKKMRAKRRMSIR
jgi:hypothetical protein